MKPSEFLQYFTDELYFLAYEDSVYLFSSYHYGDPEFDYGIYSSYDRETFPDSFDGDIPDIFVEEFMMEIPDDLAYEGIPDDVISEIQELPYIADWTDYIDNAGYGDLVPEWLRNICDVFKGTYKFEPEEVPEAESEDIECIKSSMEDDFDEEDY